MEAKQCHLFPRREWEQELERATFEEWAVVLEGRHPRGRDAYYVLAESRDAACAKACEIYPTDTMLRLEPWGDRK